MKLKRFTPAIAIAALMFLMLSLESQAQSLLDQALTQRWNHDAGEWEEVYQAIMSYDDDGNEVGTITQNWSRDESQWTNNNKCTNSFDDSGNKIAAECLGWDEDLNAWTKSYRFEFTHNEDNLKTVFLDLRWNEETESWDKKRKDTYEYDAKGNCILYTWYKYSTESGNWIPNMKVSYGYDDKGNRIDQQKADFKNGTWRPSWKNVYQYDEKGTNSGKLVLHWNAKKSDWVESSRWAYEQKDGKVVRSHKTDLIQGEWNKSQEVTYAYDSRGRKIEKLSVTKTNRDSEDHLMRTRYVYKDAPELITLKESTAAELSNYPNPFAGSTTIRFELAEKGRVQIHLHDLQGKLIRRMLDSDYEAGVHELNFDGGTLAPGIYHYSMILSDGRAISRKMVVTAK